MNSIVQKFSIIVCTAPFFLTYGGLVAAHIFIEYSYHQSTLHNKLNIIEKIPGVTHSDYGDNYCADSWAIGAIGLATWDSELCETEPVLWLSVTSRYAGKEWALFVNSENRVVHKNFW